MVVWTGLGFLVAVFAFGAALFCNWAFDASWGEGYYSSHYWTIGFAMLIGAVLSWSVGKFLRNRSARVVIDKITREELVIDRSNHTFFFVRMHNWGLILAAISVILFAMELAGVSAR